MNDPVARQAVEAAIRAAAQRLPDVAWYGFGSFFEGVEAYGDIDILVVCPDARAGIDARAALSDVAAAWPIHITVMDRVEAAETSFVRAQRCRPLT